MKLNRKLLGAAAVALFSAAAGMSQSVSQGLPPLIDRELLFGDPEIAGASLSPNGEYIAFQKPWNGTRNVWVKKTSEPFSAARLMTTETKRPVAGVLWTRDSRFIVFVKDNGGDENFNVFAVDPTAPKAAGSEAPPSRDLTGLKGVRVMLYSAPKNDPGVLYIGLNDRDKAWHDLYKLDIASGTKTLLRKNTDKISSWFFDEKGNLRLAIHSADNGDSEIMRVDAAGLVKVYSCTIIESCAPVKFHPDGKRVYMSTDKGLERSELVLFDPETAKSQTVESDPMKRVDFGGAVFSDVTGELLLTEYVDDRARLYFHNKPFEAAYKFLEQKFPKLDISITSRTSDESKWLVSVNGDTEPGVVYLYEPKTKKLELQYKLFDKLARTSLAEMKPVRYKSSDGLEIPGYLTVPKGIAAKSLPVLVFPHGGPWGRDYWGFSPFVQFFANRGYAVLTMNFRGSTGYGSRFLNAGNGEWGRKMQDDITWGVKYLVSEGIADPKRVGIIGGSYGGYATLAGVAFTPDVYRAAVDIVGPSNLSTLLESIPPYWESVRKMFYARMADPNTDAGKQWFKERSPLYSAAAIKTPLMVVQGANDPRVNKAEAEQIVIALRDRKFPVEYLLAPDEGHGFQRPVNNMAMLMAIEKFFARHLDGRYQEGGTPEVVKRLSEITVDTATVKLAKKADVGGAVGAPKPAFELVTGTWKYDAKIAVGGQQMAIKIATTVAEKDGAWQLTDTMETPMGAATDTVTADKASLQLKKRSVRQGPMNLDLEADSTHIFGKLAMGGSDKAVDIPLDGPLYADGAGAYNALAALPLAVGYELTYRNVDTQKQKQRLLHLKVAASEQVTVPAGAFDSWKLEVTPADGSAGQTTIWIAKDKRVPVKISAVLPEMGGATLTAELVP